MELGIVMIDAKNGETEDGDGHKAKKSKATYYATIVFQKTDQHTKNSRKQTTI